MRTFITPLVVFLLLCTPVHVSTASKNAEYTRLLERIVVLLQKQVALLKAAREAGGVQSVQRTQHSAAAFASIPDVSDLMSSQYHKGRYRALYVIQNGEPLLLRGRVSELDSTIWVRFARIASPEFVREYIQEFRTYSDPDAEFDAFVDRDTETGHWILGVNVYDLTTTDVRERKELDELLLHEIGHIVLDENPRMFETFTKQFWDEDDLEHAALLESVDEEALRDDIASAYFRKHPTTFVSEYAATSPLEDAVESFTFFVLRERSVEKSNKGEKIRFFYGYTDLIPMRTHIRRSL